MCFKKSSGFSPEAVGVGIMFGIVVRLFVGRDEPGAVRGFDLELLGLPRREGLQPREAALGAGRS